jgi:hypothetical protein
VQHCGSDFIDQVPVHAAAYEGAYAFVFDGVSAGVDAHFIGHIFKVTLECGLCKQRPEVFENTPSGTGEFDKPVRVV